MHWKKKVSLVLCSIALITSVAHGLQKFQKLIPNGAKVIAGSKALGHQNDAGSGARNVFGKAFKDAGFKWSKALCEADSDGDGQTNGFELGDPNCCWNEGDTPKFSTELSHPGKSTSKSNRTATRRLGGGHDDHEHGDGKGTKNTCGTESSGYSLQPSFVQVVMVALLMLF